MRASNTLDRMSDVGGLSRNDLLYGLPMTPGGIKGTTYLDKKWNIATILLFESEKLLEGYPVRYDLKENELEVKAKNGTKVIESKNIKSVVWRDSLTQLPKFFINGGEYTDEGTPLNGLLEVLADGKVPLLKRNYIVIKAPDYVVGFDVGSRDTKIFKKSTYYYATGKNLTKITSKKTLLPAFGDDAVEVEKFIKTNKLSTNNDRDLAMVFDGYNAKFKQETHCFN